MTLKPGDVAHPRSSPPDTGAQFPSSFFPFPASSSNDHHRGSVSLPPQFPFRFGPVIDGHESRFALPGFAPPQSLKRYPNSDELPDSSSSPLPLQVLRSFVSAARIPCVPATFPQNLLAQLPLSCVPSISVLTPGLVFIFNSVGFQPLNTRRNPPPQLRDGVIFFSTVTNSRYHSWDP